MRTQPFTLKVDQNLPESEQTVFTLRPLSKTAALRIRLAIGDNGTKPADTFSDEAAFTMRLLACKHGIVGWRNFRDSSGRAVPCTFAVERGERVLSDESMQFIDPWADELGSEILALTGRSLGIPETQGAR